jgi:DNA invertase Pin-like site-specific DNA recombinase
MGSITYGYIRVSSKDQNEERQKIAMLQYGVCSEYIFSDKVSGKDFERPGYKKMCRKLKAGDTLVVKSIDRLGRNYNEILQQWRYLSGKKNIGIVVLDMPLLDTRKSKDLTSELIADIVLQLLSYVAQIEREFIHQRQEEGIMAAKMRGVKFGRSPIVKPDQYENVKEEWNSGNISARTAAKRLGISHQTFLKWVRET